MNSVQSGRRQIYYVSNPDPVVNSTRNSSVSPPSMPHPIRLLPSINTQQTTHIKALPIPRQHPSSAPTVASKAPTPPHDSPSSPETSDASSTVSALSRDETLIMVTKGDSGFFTVELIRGDDGCLIRERILSVLRVPDADHDNVAVYRTELRDQRPLGRPLTNEQLLEVCEKEGDTRGTLHFCLESSDFTIDASIPPPTPPSEVLDGYPADGYSGYVASDESTRRMPSTSLVTQPKSPPRDTSQSPPSSAAMNIIRSNNVVTPFPRQNVASPSKPPRALPLPAVVQASFANGLGPAPQWPAPDWLNVEMGAPRPSSSLGQHVPGAWSSSSSNALAPLETNIRPPPRSDSLDSTSPYSNVPGSAAKANSPRKSPMFTRRPTGVPPVPPPDTQPYFQNPGSFAPGSYRNVPTGLSQVSSQVQTPSRYLPVSGIGAASYNLSGVPGSMPPAAQGQRLLSPRGGSSPKQLIGARSFDNLRGSRPLPLGPKQAPTPVQSSGLANQAGPSTVFTQTPTASNTSPTLSPVGPPVVPAGVGTRKPGDSKRRDPVYTKRPSIADSSVEGSSRLPGGGGLTRSPAINAGRIVSRTGGSSRPSLPPAGPPPPPPPVQLQQASPSPIPIPLPRREASRPDRAALRVEIPSGTMPIPSFLARVERQQRQQQQQQGVDHVPDSAADLAREQRSRSRPSLDSNSILTVGSSAYSPSQDWAVPIVGGLPGLDNATIGSSARSTASIRQLGSDGSSTLVPAPVPLPRRPTTPSMPQRQLDFGDSDSSETESDSDEDLGTLLIPISRPPTIAPAEQPTLKPPTVTKPSSSPVKTNFRKDEAWLVRPAAEAVYEQLDIYFPDHNLDEPMIDASSPTDSSESRPPEPRTNNDPLNASVREKHRKSIRVVVDERKNKIKQMKQMFSRGSNKDQKKESQAALLRRRSTKLWGSRVEELPMHAHAQDIPQVPSIPELDTVNGEDTEMEEESRREKAGDGEEDEEERVKNGEEDQKIEKVEEREKQVTFQWVRGDLIGRGTYGRVYLALNGMTGEMMAVKQVELPTTVSDMEDARQISVVEALRSESSTLRTLDHPNIVQYLGIQEDKKYLSIFLEYIPGGSVGSCLRKYGKFQEDNIKSFTRDILEGLSYLHSVGVLHRDLKADNILVDPRGKCKISDFGISKRAEDIYKNETNTAMMGSIFWMAPEVLTSNHEGYSAKIDIWSLGCVVLEMWAGRRPWNQEDMITVMYKLGSTRQAPPVPDDVVLGEFAEDFRQKCFSVDAVLRPTAAELCVHPYLTLPRNWKFRGFPRKESPSS